MEHGFAGEESPDGHAVNAANQLVSLPAFQAVRMAAFVKPCVGVDEFSAGDVGYVRQGFGHYIENIGDEELKIVIVFNNATYESISITGWLASNSDRLLATNFGVPEKIFAEMPSGPVIIPEQGKV